MFNASTFGMFVYREAMSNNTSTLSPSMGTFVLYFNEAPIMLIFLLVKHICWLDNFYHALNIYFSFQYTFMIFVKYIWLRILFEKYMFIENIYAVWKSLCQLKVYLTFLKIYSNCNIFAEIE